MTLHAPLKPIISAQQIQERVQALAQTLQTSYGSLSLSAERPLLVLIILNGAFMFAADLLRAMQLPTELIFLRLSSYGNNHQSSGQLLGLEELEKFKLEHLKQEHLKPEQPEASTWHNRHVLIIDDILDTGLTLGKLVHRLQQDFRPASVKTAVLLTKRGTRRPELANFKADLSGFEIDNTFVVGYGLDDAGRHRHLPDIYTINPDV